MTTSLNPNSFTGTDLGVHQMSIEQLKDIALNRVGVVGSIGGGYSTPDKVEGRDGWRFVWINTKGLGNQGTLVMKGVTKENKELLHQGMVKHLMDNYEVDYTIATIIVDITKRLRCGREPEVIRCAIETFKSPCWKFYPGQGNGVNSWRTQWEELKDFDHLTVPRLEIVRIIVKQIRHVLN